MYTIAHLNLSRSSYEFKSWSTCFVKKIDDSLAEAWQTYRQMQPVLCLDIAQKKLFVNTCAFRNGDISAVLLL